MQMIFLWGGFALATVVAKPSALQKPLKPAKYSFIHAEKFFKKTFLFRKKLDSI